MSRVSRLKRKPKKARKSYLYLFKGQPGLYWGYFARIKEWYVFQSRLNAWSRRGQQPVIFPPQSKRENVWTPTSRLELLVVYGIHWKAQVHKLECALNLIRSRIGVTWITEQDLYNAGGLFVDLKTEKIQSIDPHERDHCYNKHKFCDCCVTEDRVYVSRELISQYFWNFSKLPERVRLFPLT